MSLTDAMVEGLGKLPPEERGGIIYLGNPTIPILTVQGVLSTGLPNLDRILCCSDKGEWGLPLGKIISIKSKPSVGKTSFLLKVADQSLKKNGAVYFIESERALDINYARKICSGIDKFFITQPDTLEEAFETVDIALNICIKSRNLKKNQDLSDAPFLIIMDSFSGFPVKGELQGGFGSSGKALGSHARVAALACRKLTGKIAKANALFLISHQSKSKIGVFWGNSETNIGGDAFNFHDSISLHLYRTTSIKDKDRKVCGHYGVARTQKNKLLIPHMEAKFKITNGKGFLTYFGILDFLVSKELVKKVKGEFIFSENKDWKFDSENDFLEFFSHNKKASIYIKRKLKGNE